MIADALYAAAFVDTGRPTPSERSQERARETVRRFLQDLPGELTVADLRAELEEAE